MPSIWKTVIFVSVLFFTVPAQAIDLNCDVLTTTMIKRLNDEGLLINNSDGQQQAKQIVLSSCMTAENSAQVQLEATKKSWVKNWLLEDTGGKPGNKRLKNLKH